MISNYGWIITKVYDPDCQNEIGTIGPSDIPDEGYAAVRQYNPNIIDPVLENIATGEIVRFRMFTDDMEDDEWDFDGPPGLIYEGIQWLRDGVNGDDGEGLIGPLYDWGRPNYGCAHIQHWVDGKWSWVVG